MIAMRERRCRMMKLNRAGIPRVCGLGWTRLPTIVFAVLVTTVCTIVWTDSTGAQERSVVTEDHAESRGSDSWEAAGDLDRRLEYPACSTGKPGAGKRVSVTTREYLGSDVHHTLYLPEDWNQQDRASGKRWPLIVEYTGNHFPAAGSTGNVEDARLGYGISGGQFIWAVFPFVDSQAQSNAIRWWGDAAATVEYAKRNVPRICDEYGADPRAVFLCGFSRGAIAASYIGLHDDPIAKLWCGLVTHDHFDGLQAWKGTKWGFPLESYRKAAAFRLTRLDGRPLLVCQSGGTARVRDYLKTQVPEETMTFVDVDPGAILGSFPNAIAIHPHTDGWLAADSPQRRQVWAWVDRTLESCTRKTELPVNRVEVSE